RHAMLEVLNRAFARILVPQAVYLIASLRTQQFSASLGQRIGIRQAGVGQPCPFVRAGETVGERRLPCPARHEESGGLNCWPVDQRLVGLLLIEVTFVALAPARVMQPLDRRCCEIAPYGQRVQNIKIALLDLDRPANPARATALGCARWILIDHSSSFITAPL